jgi:endonuclease YncB( thermonuclease family)
MNLGMFRIALLLIAIGAHSAWAGGMKVSHVTDGDTVWVRPAGGGRPVKLRLAGIDAPEICQAGGRAARAALAGRVAGRTVVVATQGRDDYGRAVATVQLDGQDVAGWMVAQGHAWSYHHGREGGPYLGLQAQARSARRGLFAHPQTLPPRLFRKQHGPCRP